MNKGEGTGGPAGIKHQGQQRQGSAAPWRRERPDGQATTLGSAQPTPDPGAEQASCEGETGQSHGGLLWLGYQAAQGR
jgi:hypothetical protein